MCMWHTFDWISGCPLCMVLVKCLTNNHFHRQTLKPDQWLLQQKTSLFREHIICYIQYIVNKFEKNNDMIFRPYRPVLTHCVCLCVSVCVYLQLFTCACVCACDFECDRVCPCALVDTVLKPCAKRHCSRHNHLLIACWHTSLSVMQASNYANYLHRHCDKV
jgi:hypothetical protein